jgi:hypothetical protein
MLERLNNWLLKSYETNSSFMVTARQISYAILVTGEKPAIETGN